MRKSLALFVALFVVGLMPSSSSAIGDAKMGGKPADALVYQLPIQLDPSSPRYRDQLEVQRQIAFRLKAERELEKVRRQLKKARKDNVWYVSQLGDLANDLSGVETQLAECQQEPECRLGPDQPSDQHGSIISVDCQPCIDAAFKWQQQLTPRDRMMLEYARGHEVRPPPGLLIDTTTHRDGILP